LLTLSYKYLLPQLSFSTLPPFIPKTHISGGGIDEELKNLGKTSPKIFEVFDFLFFGKKWPSTSSSWRLIYSYLPLPLL